MKADRILSIIVGICLAIGGLYCAMHPGITYLSKSWIIIAGMLIYGLGGAARYSSLRRIGKANGFPLVSYFLAIGLAVVLMISMAMRFSTMVLLLYFVMFWMIATGISRIITAFRLRKIHSETETGLGRNWGWLLVIGILLSVTGLLGFARPMAAALTIGLIIGTGLFISGLDMILFGTAAE